MKLRERTLKNSNFSLSQSLLEKRSSDSSYCSILEKKQNDIMECQNDQGGGSSIPQLNPFSWNPWKVPPPSGIPVINSMTKQLMPQHPLPVEEFDPIPTPKPGELQVQNQWPLQEDFLVKFHVKVERLKPRHPTLETSAEFILQRIAGWKEAGVKKRFPIDSPRHLLWTGHTENMLIKQGLRDLSLVLSQQNLSPNEGPCNAHKLHNTVKNIEIYLQIPLLSSDSIHCPLERLKFQANNILVVKHEESQPIAEFKVSCGIKSRIQDHFPQWSEAQGLQIFTTPFLRKHLLNQWRKKFPVFDVQKQYYHPQRLDHSFSQNFGLIIVTSWIHQIDKTQPWVYVNNQSSILQVEKDLTPEQAHAARKFIRPADPESAPLQEYLQDLIPFREEAIQKGLYIKVNDMTTSHTSRYYLRDYFQPIPRTPLSITYILHYFLDPTWSSESNPRITDFTFGCTKQEISNFLSKSPNPEDWIDKAKSKIGYLRKRAPHEDPNRGQIKRARF